MSEKLLKPLPSVIHGSVQWKVGHDAPMIHGSVQWKVGHDPSMIHGSVQWKVGSNPTDLWINTVRGWI